MTVTRSIVLFVAAALLEIGGAWLIWQGVREHRGWAWIGAGVVALGLYGFVATLQPDAHFGRILAAYGGVFVVGSLAWGMVADDFKPDRWDVTGALVCLLGVALIMYGPRPPTPERRCSPSPSLGHVPPVARGAGASDAAQAEPPTTTTRPGAPATSRRPRSRA